MSSVSSYFQDDQGPHLHYDHQANERTGVRCWWSVADTKTGPGPPGQVAPAPARLIYRDD